LSNSERKNDEFPNPEELKKQGVRDEEDRIGNNYKEPAEDNLLSKGNKNENNEDNKNGNESNAVSDADVIFMFYNIVIIIIISNNLFIMF